jgi:large subunit ribosomal protein L19
MNDEPKTTDDQPTDTEEKEGQEEVKSSKPSQPSEPAVAAPKPAPVKTTDVFKVGDLVKVTTRDPKENKVHATPFEGIVIAFRGTGDSKTFTVRRVGAMKVAIERIFPFKSPAIESIKVIKSNNVQQAKLYYLRKKVSKK